MRARLLHLARIFFFIVFILALGVEGKKKKIPLQPFFAKEISEDVKEPSGASYCSTTHSLWLICDKPSCHYIYETTLEGELINAWEFSGGGHDDVEAVACDDQNQLIYIAEEGYMRITSFVLPHIDREDTYTVNNSGKLNLIELDHIFVDLDGLRGSEYVNDVDDDDLPPGLEGLTWIPSKNSFVVANEKQPPMIVTISLRGEIENVEYPDYPDDVSGLAYDDNLDKLWVLSDQSERVYLTDLLGHEVYDYWDLPMENPEGVAVNNQLDPPVLYVVTDPSSPHGKQYISAFFAFTKPEIGTGLVYYDKNNPPPAPVECNGCDEVWDLADDLSSAFISSDDLSVLAPQSPSSSSSSSGEIVAILFASILPSFAFICTLIFTISLYIYVSRNKDWFPKSFREEKNLYDSGFEETEELLSNTYVSASDTLEGGKNTFGFLDDNFFSSSSDTEEKEEKYSSFGSSNDAV